MNGILQTSILGILFSLSGINQNISHQPLKINEDTTPYTRDSSLYYLTKDDWFFQYSERVGTISILSHESNIPDKYYKEGIRDFWRYTLTPDSSFVYRITQRERHYFNWEITSEQYLIAKLVGDEKVYTYKILQLDNDRLVLLNERRKID